MSGADLLIALLGTPALCALLAVPVLVRIWWLTRDRD